MKKTLQLTLFVLSTALMIGSCSNETDTLVIDTTTPSLVNTYNRLISLPSLALLGEVTETTRSEGLSYPTMTQEDLRHLQSLTQSEAEQAIDSVINLAGGQEAIDDIQASNYMSVYTRVGGKDGIDALVEFSVQYLNMKPGWDSLTQIIPSSILNSPSGQQYIEQAAYIDRIARPVCELMISSKWEHDLPMCKAQLVNDLCYAGVSISTDAFLDAMSGGVETPELILQLISAGVNVYEAYHNYETCNGRWH